jgi:hypothetical protein
MQRETKPIFQRKLIVSLGNSRIWPVSDGNQGYFFLTQRARRTRRWRGKWEIALRLIKRGVSGFWDLMGVDEIINESVLALNEGWFVREFEGFI